MENKKELIVKDRHGVEHNLYDLPKNFVFDGDIDLSGSSLRELPDLSTVTVTGDFKCDGCKNLTSLKGAPSAVKGDFSCFICHNLTSLKGAPKEVGGNFECSDCKNLTSLEGAPQKVGGTFDCGVCPKLTSLKGAPKEVGEDFCCYACNITSLEGAPQKVGKDFSCDYCDKLTSLRGAPKKIGEYFYCKYCTTLKSLIHIPECKGVAGNTSILELLKQYTSCIQGNYGISARYEDIVSSPKYKQELAIEASMSKTKAKLEAKHQDGEKTAPKKQVASAVNATVLKAKESRDI